MTDRRSERQVETPLGPVSSVVDGHGSTAVLVAHGAGAPMTHPFMEETAHDLAHCGLTVVRFNFRYAEIGRRAPDRMPALVEVFRAVLADVVNPLDPQRVVLAGKSMGGRAAAVLASEADPAGVVFLGYPLHPPGRPESLRNEPLRDLRVPALFVEGTRDPFCPLPTLERLRRELTAPTDLLVVEDGDHSFRVRRSSGRTSREALRAAMQRTAEWIRSL